MLWLSYGSFSILSCVFCQKKCHFQLKQLCLGPAIINLMDNIQCQHESVYLEQQPHLPSTSTEANDMNTMLTTEIQNNSVSPFLADLIDLMASNMDNYQIWSNQKGAWIFHKKQYHIPVILHVCWQQKSTGWSLKLT